VAGVRMNLALVSEACKRRSSSTRFARATLNGGLFGSALAFGSAICLEGARQFAPRPREQESNLRKVEAAEPRMSAFVFKIQANMTRTISRFAFAFGPAGSGQAQPAHFLSRAKTGAAPARTCRSPGPTVLLCPGIARWAGRGLWPAKTSSAFTNHGNVADRRTR